MKARTQSTPQYIAAIIIITIIYFVVGKLGLLLAVPHTNVTPIYPASGFAFAIVLLYGYAVTPAIFMASFVMNITTLLSNVPQAGIWTIIAISFATGVGAALQAAFGAALVRHFISSGHIFLNVSSVLKFLLFGIISCLVNAFIGSLSLCIEGIVPWSFWSLVWWTWLVGDAGGVFVISPLMLVWLGKQPRPLSPSQTLEATVLLLLIGVIAYLNQTVHADFLYLYLPCLIWAAARFYMHGATLAIFITATLVVLQTAHGMGPLAYHPLDTSLTLLILFILVITGTILALAVELKNRSTMPTRVWEGRPGFFASLKRFWLSLFQRQK